MLLGLKTKAIVVGAMFVAIAFGGWQARAWYEDSQELTAMDAVRLALASERERESSIATMVEDKLAGLRTNERIIDRGIIREIEKPVYQRVCLPDDAVRLLNSAATGSGDGPSGASGEVSDNPAATD